jgi:epoxyqueuosine reductase
MNRAEIRALLEKLALEKGFIGVGCAAVRRLNEEEDHLRDWLKRGFQGSMGYMERNFEKRLDPGLLVPGAKTVIVFLYNYYSDKQQQPGTPKIARYARGEDYHRVVKDQIYRIMGELETHTGKINGRVFVDSAPVMERQWAVLAGLGWIGKNSLLLRKGVGSYFFIGTAICDLELEPDDPVLPHCGECTACIDACPTNAIVADGVIDARRCISYITIESKEPMPADIRANSQNWAFGCDICQEVCPWNRFSEPHGEPRFEPRENFENWDTETWKQLNEETFNALFGHTPLSRAGWLKFKDSSGFL